MPKPATPKPPRPAWLILAQFESGRIAAAVTTDVDAWRDERVRLDDCAFGRFADFVFGSVDQAKAALEALTAEIRAQYGVQRITADQQLVACYSADWPIVLDTFRRKNKLRVAA